MKPSWVRKFLWQFVSFKFLAFWGVITILISVWYRLEKLYLITIRETSEMFAKGMLSQDNVASIITQTTTTLFSSALGHILVFTGTLLSGIIAIKGFSYWTSSKSNSTENTRDLKKFLPKEE